jgi:hypothetical protein
MAAAAAGGHSRFGGESRLSPAGCLLSEFRRGRQTFFVLFLCVLKRQKEEIIMTFSKYIYSIYANKVDFFLLKI